jgi:hypothetical protein
MLKTQIVNENGQRLNIDKEGNLNVVAHKRPPINQDTTLLPLRSYFQNNGSRDMNVNGSVTSVDFSIKADNVREKSVKSMFISIVDAGASLSEFGNLPALTNGVEFIWQSQDFGEIVIANELKSNFDFVAFAGGQPSYGNGATAFVAPNVIGNEEAILAFIDFQKLFGFEYGIPLRKGTKDKLLFRINDDTSGVTAFTAIGYGNQF